MSTSWPFVAALATRGRVAASPAPTAIRANPRRLIPRRCWANPPKSSSSHIGRSPSGGDFLQQSARTRHGQRGVLDHVFLSTDHFLAAEFEQDLARRDAVLRFGAPREQQERRIHAGV